MKPYVKWPLIVMGVAVLLVLGFYLVENYRGARAWADTKGVLESEGEALTFRELMPPLPPDEENFCAIPLIASMADYERSEDGEKVYRNPKVHDRLLAMRVPIDSPEEWPELGGFANGELPDFEGLATVFAQSSRFTFPDRSFPPAEQVLMALEAFDSEFSEMAEAAGRSEAVFRIEWKDDYFGRMKQLMFPGDGFGGLSTLLSVRAFASLAAGRPYTARESSHIQIRLAEAQSRQPTPVSLTHTASVISRSLLDPVWFGLKTNAWRDEDLDWLAENLKADDLIEGALLNFRAEMVGMHIEMPDHFKRTAAGFETLGVFGEGDKWFEFVEKFVPLAAMPGGWWDLNKHDGCRILYEGAIHPLKSRGDFMHLSNGFFHYERNRPLDFLLPTSLSNDEGVLGTVLETVADLEFARVSCALEREFRETGRYPAALSSLVPGRLDAVPSDPIDRKPLRYRRTADGRYRLYSIGSNGIDDGGKVWFDPNTGFRNSEKGDWVWAYSFPEREEVPD